MPTLTVATPKEFYRLFQSIQTITFNVSLKKRSNVIEKNTHVLVSEALRITFSLQISSTFLLQCK